MYNDVYQWFLYNISYSAASVYRVLALLFVIAIGISIICIPFKLTAIAKAIRESQEKKQ